MKTYNKTHKPDSITHNGQVYKYDANATELYREGKLISSKDHVLVNSMQSILKGRTDLHGKPYKPVQFIFSTELGALKAAAPAKVIDTSPGAVKELKRIRTYGYGV